MFESFTFVPALRYTILTMRLFTSQLNRGINSNYTIYHAWTGFDAVSTSLSALHSYGRLVKAYPSSYLSTDYPC